MKSRGNLEAELKERIEFSLTDFILPSEDCNMFIPLPLCPATMNFPNLNPLFISSSSPFTSNSTNQTTKSNKNLKIYRGKTENVEDESKKTDLRRREGTNRTRKMRHFQGLDRGWERRRHGRL